MDFTSTGLFGKITIFTETKEEENIKETSAAAHTESAHQSLT